MSKSMSRLTVDSDLLIRIEGVACDHDRWVDNFGLQTGEPGPLDKLIDELELAIVIAKRKKREAEEDDE